MGFNIDQVDFDNITTVVRDALTLPPKGTIIFNSTTNQWEGNTGTAGVPVWTPIPGASAGVGELPAVQALRTTTLNYTLNTFTDVTFNTTDIENDSAVIEHNNVNTDDFDIKEDGLYLVNYSAHFDCSNGSSIDPTLETRVRLNDSTVLNGSFAKETQHYSFSGGIMEEFKNEVAFVAELTAGDFITLQERYVTSALTADNGGVDLRMTIVKDDGTWVLPGTASLITKAGIVAFGTFALSGGVYKSTVTFGTAFSDNLYAPTITGEDSRNWTIESKGAGSFIINSNSNVTPAGDTFWNAIKSGETS